VEKFTYADLRRVLRESAGDDIGGPDAGDADIPLGDLGYDSLAVLDAVGRLARDHGLEIPDDGITVATTASDAVAYVNRRLASEM
jgi:minimal PKS acyl carrier protein